MSEISFESAIDMETPIEILDDNSLAKQPIEDKKPKEVKPTEDKKPVEDKKDLLEVNLEDENKIEDKEIPPTPIDNSSSSQKNTLHVLANALFEEGVISSFNEEDYKEDEFSADNLLDLMRAEINANVDNYKNGLPHAVRELIENYEEGVPLNKLLDVKSKTIEYDGITEDALLLDTELQKNIIRLNLEDKGYSSDKINKRIKQFEDLEALSDEAIDALNEQKASAKEKEDRLILEEKQAAVRAREESNRQLERLKDDVYSTKEIVPGIEITKKDQNAIYKSMTDIVEKDSAGNPLNAVMSTRLKNPLAFEKAVHYYHSLGLFNIDDKGQFKPDFSKVNKVSKKRAIDEITDLLDSKKPLSSGTPVREPYNKDHMKSNIESLRALMRQY